MLDYFEGGRLPLPDGDIALRQARQLIGFADRLAWKYFTFSTSDRPAGRCLPKTAPGSPFIRKCNVHRTIVR